MLVRHSLFLFNYFSLSVCLFWFRWVQMRQDQLEWLGHPAANLKLETFQIQFLTTVLFRKQWPRPRVLYWDRTPLGVRLVARRLCRRASSRTTSGVLYQYRIRARGHCLNSDPRKCGTLSPLCIITQMGFLAKFQLSQNQLNTFFYGQIIYKS